MGAASITVLQHGDGIRVMINCKCGIFTASRNGLGYFGVDQLAP